MTNPAENPPINNLQRQFAVSNTCLVRASLCWDTRDWGIILSLLKWNFDKVLDWQFFVKSELSQKRRCDRCPQEFLSLHHWSHLMPSHFHAGRDVTFLFKKISKKKFNTLSPSGLRLRVARTVLNPTEFQSIPKSEHNVENEVWENI